MEISDIMAFKRLTDFYYFEVGSYGARYIVMLVLTVQFATMALLLDAARVSLTLFKMELSPLFLSLGMIFFLTDISLGIIEKSSRAKSRGGFMVVILEAARTTSYVVLPFMWIAMTVLLYFGGPSESFFPYMKLAMFLFTILGTLPSLVKTLTLQIPLLFNPVWDRASQRVILVSSTVAITFFGAYSYLASVYMLPTIFLTWFMYVTTMMFLEVFLLFLVAETMINFRRDLYMFTVLLYLLVLTYSVFGVMETFKLTIDSYGEVLPKVLTGLLLIIVNVKLIDLRLLSSARGEIHQEIVQGAYEPYGELKDLLQKLYQEAVENRRSVQRQQRALLELYNLINRGSPTGAPSSGELHQELEKIRTYIEKTSVGLSERLVEVVKKVAVEVAKQAKVNPRDIIAYLLGPRVLVEGQTRRNKMLEEVSPFVPLVFVYIAREEAVTGLPMRTIKRSSLADFLRHNYPLFESIWSRRTMQDFIKGLIDNYLLSYKESSIFFRPKGLEIEVAESETNVWLLEAYKDEFAKSHGEVDLILILHELKKMKNLLKEEFSLKDEEIYLYKEKE